MSNASTDSAATRNELTPRQIVEELDKFIVGQDEAKRCVAIALRNRVRRRMLDERMQDEIIPKNIIMIGPTGVGKTEIARRLARLVKAPFVKVEATKYTEVGYVGRDVESMVRDLTETAVTLVREEMTETVRPEAERRVREKLLELLRPSDPGPRRFLGGSIEDPEASIEGDENEAPPLPREKLAALLDAGGLEEREIEVEIAQQGGADVMLGMGGMDDQMMQSLRDMVDKMTPQRRQRSRMKIADARRVLMEETLDDLLDPATVKREAIARTEQSGIIFIDELDKVAAGSRDGRGGGPDVSREGVQRDILPIVEGSSVNTKHGAVRTDHVLFIAAGAFHMSKPSDLIPELQGRFPLRVELKALEAADFERIMTEPEHSLTRQYAALMGSDGVEMEFAPDGVGAIAEAAMHLNRETENIGARRLHAILERVLEDVAFDAPDRVDGKVTVNKDYVDQRLTPIMKDQDLSRFIL